MSVLEPGDLGFNAEYPKKSIKNLCDEKSGTALAVPAVPSMPPLPKGDPKYLFYPFIY